MAVLIGSARINELGKGEGGQPGDQNGKEVAIENWYLHDKGWVVIRAKDETVRKKIAQDMRYICENDNIGYSYNLNRRGLVNAAKQYNYDASRVRVKCETDCSMSAVCCIRFAGVNVEDFTTANEVEKCKSTGAFDILTDDKYCKSSDYLLEGDILVTKTMGHTVVVLNDGPKAKETLKMPDFYFQTFTYNGVNITAGTPGTRAVQRSKTLLKIGYRPIVARLASVSDSSLANVVPFLGGGSDNKLYINYYRASGASGTINAAITIVYVRNDLL